MAVDLSMLTDKEVIAELNDITEQIRTGSFGRFEMLIEQGLWDEIGKRKLEVIENPKRYSLKKNEKDK